LGETARIGDFDEADAEPGQRRIGAPEAVVAAEVGQPGIDADAGAGPDQQGIGVRSRAAARTIGSGCIHELPDEGSAYAALTQKDGGCGEIGFR
jgi:hypothetical protein